MSNSGANTKRNIAVVVCIAIAALVGWKVFGSDDSAVSSAEGARHTESHFHRNTIRGEGRVATYPGGMVKVGTETGGLLVRLHVQEQDVVKKGQLLAEFSSDEQRAALAEAKAKVAEINSSIRLLELENERARKLLQDASIAQQAVDKLVNDLETTKAQRGVAQAVAARLETVLEKTRIHAPISGTVTARPAEAGEVVPPGAELLTIADLSNRRIEAEIDEYDVGRIAEGDTVEITAEGYEGESWLGVLEVVPEALNARRLTPFDPGRPADTRALLVKISLPSDCPLKLGQRVEVLIRAQDPQKPTVE